MALRRSALLLPLLGLATLIVSWSAPAFAGPCGENEPNSFEWNVPDAEGQPLYRAVFSGRSGTLVCMELLHQQFQLAKSPDLTEAELAALPEWLSQPGPLDMVTTWKDEFLPYRLAFKEVDFSGQVERVLVAPVEKAVADGFVAGSTRKGGFLELYQADPIYTLVKSTADEVVYVWPDPAKDKSDLFIERRFYRGPDYRMELAFTVYNFSGVVATVHPEVSAFAWQLKQPKTGLFAPQPDVSEALCQTPETLERESEDALREAALDRNEARWVAVGSRYFIKAMIPKAFREARCNLTTYPNHVIEAKIYGGNPVAISPWDGSNCYPTWYKPAETLTRCEAVAKQMGLASERELFQLARNPSASGASKETVEANMALLKSLGGGKGLAWWSLDLYMGPKDMGLLQNPGVGLEDSIDFWIVGIISKPMLWALRWFYSLIPNWVVAIILLTLVVKIITYYPTMRSFVQMQRMASLKPLMDDLKVKYEGDKQKQSTELMALYKREKINPLGGCLPVLLQMPIWIALYRTIYSSVDLFQVPVGFWITDMTQPDPYFVMPVVLGGLMFLQQKMTPTTMDNAQAKMMLYAMPIMFGVFSLFLPSALNLYILVNTILSIGQQGYLRRTFGQSVAKTANTKRRKL